MAEFLDKQGLTTYSNLIKGELDTLDARIEALETGGKYMPISGGTFTGNVTMGSGTKLSGIVTPVSDNDAVNKAYVDSKAPFAYLALTTYSVENEGEIRLANILTSSTSQFRSLQYNVNSGSMNFTGLNLYGSGAKSNDFLVTGLTITTTSANATIGATNYELLYVATIANDNKPFLGKITKYGSYSFGHDQRVILLGFY